MRIKLLHTAFYFCHFELTSIDYVFIHRTIEKTKIKFFFDFFK